jgi:peptidoglycan/LPS O-acetylase OafA/YrhL
LTRSGWTTLWTWWRSVTGNSAAPNLTPPPGNPRFPLFDSLRAIAALSVFAGHTIIESFTLGSHRQLLVLAIQVADQGVAIFFLISGFLLYRPFLTARRDGRPVSLGDYARRRVLRIVPGYWVALTIFVLAGFVSGVSAGNWWIFYGFAQNYNLNTIGQGIGVAWTLCIEVTFYLALPLFAFLAAKLGRENRSMRGDMLLLVVLAAASLAYRAHFSAYLDLPTVSTLPGFFFWFALGMGVAVASVDAGVTAAFSRLGVRARHWPVFSWALAALMFVLLHESSHANSALGVPLSAVVVHVLYGLTALFLLLPAVFDDTAGGPVRALLRLPALAWVGLVSYALYLYHTIVIAQIDKLLTEHGVSPRYLLVVVLSLPLSLACAAASFYLVERPLMRLRRRGGRPRPGPLGHELPRSEDPSPVKQEAAG